MNNIPEGFVKINFPIIVPSGDYCYKQAEESDTICCAYLKMNMFNCICKLNMYGLKIKENERNILKAPRCRALESN